MHINLSNFSNFKKNFLNYEIGNLFRLVLKNNYPTLGSEFKFIDQDDENKPFEPYYKKNILSNKFCNSHNFINFLKIIFCY